MIFRAFGRNILIVGKVLIDIQLKNAFLTTFGNCVTKNWGFRNSIIFLQSFLYFAGFPMFHLTVPLENSISEAKFEGHFSESIFYLEIDTHSFLNWEKRISPEAISPWLKPICRTQIVCKLYWEHLCHWIKLPIHNFFPWYVCM